MLARPKYIAHFDLDSFFVSVERLYNPELTRKDIHGNMPPVVVGGSADTRGVVASASYEARAYGVRSAMPMKTALKLCPHLVIVKGRHGVYGEISEKIVTRLYDFVPVIEWTSIDEGYMDFTGCEKLFHHDFQAVLKMLQQLVDEEFKLPISFGMGSTRVIAKIASGRAKPKGILIVETGTEEAFLGSLEIGEIPGIGPKTKDKLRQRGYMNVNQLQKLSERSLEQLLGKYGVDLYKIVHGLSSDEVIPEHERKSISSEETFAVDMPPDSDFESLFTPHIEEICFRLRKSGKKARTVTIKIRFENFSTITRSETIPPTNDDAVIKRTSLKLFNKYYDKKTPVRLLGIGLSNLTNPPETMDLFESHESKRETILQSVDAIRKKYGIDVIKLGAVRKN
jgi:DNA polymerase IV